MNKVKLTQKELTGLDAMIELLEKEGSPKRRKVTLGSLMLRAFTPGATYVIARITASKPVGQQTAFTEDSKILGRIEQLGGKLRSKMSLEDLLELRRSATARKD
jgi:hypothetical protein